MPIYIYKSTDAGAPVLNGLEGSLVSVLDAVLVDGYGSQPSLGWSKEFSGTNKAAYKQPVGTNEFYLQVLDDQGVNGFYALVRGYEEMLDVDTGTNPFPTIAQHANYYAVKSAVNTATAIDWVVYSNGAIIYMFYYATYNAGMFHYGYSEPLVATDEWSTSISASDNPDISNASIASYAIYNLYRYFARGVGGVSLSVLTRFDFFISGISSGTMGETYPGSSINKLFLHNQAASTNNTNIGGTGDIRCFSPGMFSILNKITTNQFIGDTFSDDNGVQYDIVKTGSVAIAIQTSGEWHG